MEPSYIETDELAELLSDTDSQTVVVDVRDDDFYGGNIPGARNVPSRMWMNTSTVTELVNDLKDADTVVFHCMLSQVRGPTCARQFLSTMKDMNLEGKPSVKVLYEGFKGWRRRYRANPFMIENDDI
jgi:Cdc25 family phosphatase